MLKSRKAALTIAAFAAILTGGGLWYALTNGTIDVTIPQEKAQSLVDGKLPLEKAKGPLHYRVETATLDFRPDGRVGVDARIQGELLKRTATGRMTGSAVVVYRNGAFFLENFAAESAKLEKTETAPSDHHLADAAKTLLGKAVHKSKEEIDEVIADNKELLLEKAKDLASEAVGKVLTERPVYTLNPANTKQALAKLALKEVKVQDGALVVTLDPLTALARLVTWALVGLLSVIVALAMVAAILENPALLLGVMTLGLLTE